MVTVFLQGILSDIGFNNNRLITAFKQMLTLRKMHILLSALKKRCKNLYRCIGELFILYIQILFDKNDCLH